MSPIPGDSRQDPHNPNGDDISIAAMETNIIIAAGSSSDSAGEDDLEDGYQGYQLLPQDPNQLQADDDDTTMDSNEAGAMGDANSDSALDESLKHSIDGDDMAASRVPSYLQVQSQGDPSIMERKSLWSESRLHPQEPMEQDHLNKIKAAMSGFNLPGCQIPEWAKVVPEEDWKTQLLTRLHGQVPLISSRTDSSSDPTDTIAEDPDSDPPNKRPRCSMGDDDESHETETTEGVQGTQEKTSTDQGGENPGEDR